MERAQFGLIGYGRFGRLIASHLARRSRTEVYDPALSPGAALEDGSRAGTLAAVCAARVVIFAVPIRALREVIAVSAPYFRPGTLVCDTASVKIGPAQWMQAALPPGVEILATHPLFGPDSASEGLGGHRIVICPVRVRHPRAIRRFLTTLGLTVEETSAEAHDREIAQTQALTHWLGRGLERLGAGPRTIDTLGYRKLLEILRYVVRDTPELFEDMQRFNPHAAEERRRMLGILSELDAELGGPGAD
ncbi:MAG: prephenate dehydrogenase [Candidatus Eisenbacteria bacterium]|nr:prephenate dehydrogenase [Candidatus Eisenbacteria bacterium]